MARRDIVLVSRTLYQVGIVTLIASVMWVGIGVYTTLTKPISGKVDQDLLEPLNTTLDKTVIDELGKRVKVEQVVVEGIEETPTASASAPLDDTIEAGTENELTN